MPKPTQAHTTKQSCSLLIPESASALGLREEDGNVRLETESIERLPRANELNKVNLAELTKQNSVIINRNSLQAVARTGVD